MKNEERLNKAKTLRSEGYNCAQVVLGAYSDLLPLSYEDTMKLGNGLGGGLGGVGTICGALNAGAMILSFIHGKSEANVEHKKYIYQLTKTFIDEFNQQYGHYDCDPLLKLTNEKISCNEYIFDAIILLEKYI